MCPLAQVGEMMDGRYEVFATHGKGVFSTVLRARDKGQQDALGRHPEVRGSRGAHRKCAQADKL